MSDYDAEREKIYDQFYGTKVGAASSVSGKTEEFIEPALIRETKIISEDLGRQSAEVKLSFTSDAPKERLHTQMKITRRIESVMENALGSKYDKFIGGELSNYVATMLNYSRDICIRRTWKYCNFAGVGSVQKNLLVDAIVAKVRVMHADMNEIKAKEHFIIAVNAFTKFSEEELVEFLDDHRKEYGTHIEMLNLVESLS